MKTEPHKKMKQETLRLRLLIILAVLSFFILNFSLISSASSFGSGVPSTFSGGAYKVYGSSVNPQFTQPNFHLSGNTNPAEYWGNFNKEDCNERQDVILQIPPGGCSPAVVRSDLLEEQNVPVFCKVSSIQINPLIDVTKIRSIRFPGKYAEGISGVSYYPARAAIRSTNTLIGDPIIDNVGYLVVVLKKTETEAKMPDWIESNITAVIDYDSEGVFGVGRHDFYLNEMSDEDWDRGYKDYGFWKGKGFIRLESLDEDSARVSIYRDANYKEASADIKKGETSGDIYLGGYYCAAGMNIKVEDIGYPVDSALLKVDDEDLWVSKGGRFLDDKCRVTSLTLGEIGGGNVKISCSGAGSFELVISDSKATLDVDGNIKDYESGEYIKNIPKENKNLYVAYIGNSAESNANFVVLVKSSDDKETFLGRGIGASLEGLNNRYKDDSGFIKTIKQASEYSWYSASFEILTQKLFSTQEAQFLSYVVGEINKEYSIDTKDIKILVDSGSDVGYWDKDLFGNQWSEYGIKLQEPILGDEFLNKEGNENLKEYYTKAIENYENVFELYPSESRMINDKASDAYASQALYNAAELSGKLGLQSEQIKYLEKLIEKYPDTKLSSQAEGELRTAYEGRVTKDSQAIVYINNEPHFISLRNFEKPSYKDFGAKLIFTINGKEKPALELEGQKTIKISDTNIPFEITEIQDDYIEVRYDADSDVLGGVVNYFAGTNTKAKTQKLEIGKTVQLASKPTVSVRLVEIKLKKQAKIKIIPKAFGMRTESNFHFKIGIEKRAIKLSPEKTQEMADNLEKQIKEWSDINEKLGKVVSGLKGACFATSAMLVVKNFFAGMSGQSMARNKVMTSEGGWNEKCRTAFADKKDICNGGTPTSVADCLLDCNDYINSDVEALSKRYEEVNSDLERIQKQVGTTKSDVLDLQKSVDTDKVKTAYCDVLKEKFDYESNKDMLIDIKGESVKLSDIFSKDDFDKCNMNLQVMKDLVAYSGLSNSENSALGGIAKSSLADSLESTYRIKEITKEQDMLAKEFKDIPNLAVFSSSKNKQYQEMNDVTPEIRKQYNFGSDVTKVFADTYEGKKVLVGLVKSGSGYKVEKVVDSSKNEIIGGAKAYSSYKTIDLFLETNPNMYQNEMKGDVKIKYYTQAPYKGLPAEVPFDKKNGWYVTTDYVLSGFGKPYEESGRAVNFWICNVGKNGLIEGKEADDCRYYNLGSSADLDFPGLSKTKSATLVKDAENALREASRRYGDKEVRINDAVYKTGIAEGGEGGSCSDFMSPSDCNLMFNVCDPVICPSSRCNFGGEYRVSNVVQSGIIGSLLLCLPNAKEGIAVPICLSGVHAGIDGYVSILNSTHACLKESLATGKNIGICDEIKSIYLCEFFWKQAIPLMEVFVPKMFEWSLGQGVRGGGEYLTVNSAWENMQKSIDFFKNEYAVNAVKAFNSRSTEEVGGEVCNMFVSARYPNSKEFFDNLVEPDSPTQYTAWFSEDVLNEATIPATSHYKVYYHIYAGKDIGASYVVYLKNPPQSAYVNTMYSYVIDRGYITKGQQIDRTRDVSSISGYKELCISINGQEECGFKQVSSSWALDELANKYAEEQFKDGDITTSKECVSGSPSLYSLAQPNLEAGASEVLNPEIYKRGIIRVCSKGNPGKQVETKASTNDRWKQVGYCDSSSIGCWLDTESVKDVLKDAPNLTQEVLNEVDSEYLEKVESLTEDKTKEIVEKGKEKVKIINLPGNIHIDLQADISKDYLDVINALIKVTEIGFNNQYRAEAFYVIGQIYGEFAKKNYNKYLKEVKSSLAGGKETEVATKNKLTEEPAEIGTIIIDEGSIEWTKTSNIQDGKYLWRSVKGSWTWESMPASSKYLVKKGDKKPEKLNEDKFNIYIFEKSSLKITFSSLECNYMNKWNCVNNENGNLIFDGLKNKNYLEGIRFLAEKMSPEVRTGYNPDKDSIEINGQKIVKYREDSTEAIMDKIMSNLKNLEIKKDRSIKINFASAGLLSGTGEVTCSYTDNKRWLCEANNLDAYKTQLNKNLKTNLGYIEGIKVISVNILLLSKTQGVSITGVQVSDEKSFTISEKNADDIELELLDKVIVNKRI